MKTATLRWALLSCMLVIAIATSPQAPTKQNKTKLLRREPKSMWTSKVGQGENPQQKGASLDTGSKRSTIEEIFANSGTDKLWRHGYHRYYETELAPYRDAKDLRIMEIGAKEGRSLGAWLEYFTSPAAVQGMAYNADANAAREKACSLFPSHCDVISIFSMDQSDVDALRDLSEKNPNGWDIVIDDGSHKPQHNLISFQKLWPKIRPGGLYVIEDIESSYVDDGTEVYGYELHGGIGAAPPNNSVEQFKRLVDVVNRKHFKHPDFTVFAGVDKDVARVSFGDGLIFVQKKPDSPDWDKYPTELIFKKRNSARSFDAYEKTVEPMNAWFRSQQPKSSELEIRIHSVAAESSVDTMIESDIEEKNDKHGIESENTGQRHAQLVPFLSVASTVLSLIYFF